MGHNVQGLWDRVHDLIVKVVLVMQPSVVVNCADLDMGQDKYKCFQVLGVTLCHRHLMWHQVTLAAFFLPISITPPPPSQALCQPP